MRRRSTSAALNSCPDARGEAKVESKQGYIEIEVEFDGLQPATRNGAEYLTYVLWAITPEGRTANLGEILLNGTKSKLDVTTELQVFGLGGHRRTVLRGHAAQRPDRDGKRGAPGHEGEDRGDRRQVRTVTAWPISASRRIRWR